MQTELTQGVVFFVTSASDLVTKRGSKQFWNTWQKEQKSFVWLLNWEEVTYKYSYCIWTQLTILLQI